MAMGILAKQTLLSSGRSWTAARQVARPAPQGRSAQDKCRERIGAVDGRSQERFGG